MSEIYKKSGDKIKLGNRNACIYTKGNRKTKYIKLNKEMVLLSKELRRLKITTKKQIGGDDLEIYDYYTDLELNYVPKPVVLLRAEKEKGWFFYKNTNTNNNNAKYANIIKIVENKEDNPPPSGTSIQMKIARHNYKEPLLKYCSKQATMQFLSALVDNTQKIKNLVHFKIDTKINVVKWNIDANSKVLIIGDIHGDAIALEKVFDKWLKEGYLLQEADNTREKPHYTIRDDVYIISTGDLIDYGTNSVYVLCAMLRLRKDNPKKVMLLCGNHEVKTEIYGKTDDGKTIYNITGRKDVIAEISKKENATSSANKYSDIQKEIINLLITNTEYIGPDMLALHFGDELEGTYFMHGMYPIKQDNLSLKIWPLDETEAFKESVDDYGYKKTTSQLLSELIQWNDVTTDPNGVTVSSQRGLPECVAVGTYEIIKVMNMYGIKGFIRGHQDVCGTYLYPLENYDYNKTDKDICKNTENIKHTYIDTKQISTRTCRHAIDPKDDKWCTNNETIKYAWENIPLPDITGSEITNDKLSDLTKKIKNRIITTSMANQKSGIAPLGGYIKLTVEKI